MILLMNIGDLHCDLLLYLQGDASRSPYDLDVRCSIPQLRQGNVKLQVMAAFTETNLGSVHSGEKQVDIFASLSDKYPDDFLTIRSADQLDKVCNQIGILLAFENGSTFCSEDEPLTQAFHRYENIEARTGKIAYVSMTWNSENRFGGGAFSPVGLKADGKRLLDFLHGRRTAIDFSHASDKLITETLEYIDAAGLYIPVMASHSNFRSVADAPRNLPDDLAKEICRRGGIIGFNFVRTFVGPETTDNFVSQLNHALTLGLGSHLCFGADFFYIDDVPEKFRKKADETFFPEFDHAGCYKKVIALWQDKGKVTTDQIQQISYGNMHRFLCDRVL